jgi:hypothetical protein
MAAPKYQHTVQLPAELEEAWLTYHQQHPTETFNGFVTKVIRQELELLCVTNAPSLITR